MNAKPNHPSMADRAELAAIRFRTRTGCGAEPISGRVDIILPAGRLRVTPNEVDILIDWHLITLGYSVDEGPGAGADEGGAA